MGTSFTANLFHINHSIYNNNIASEKANTEACNALTLRSQKERPEVPALKICFVTNKKKVDLLRQGRNLKGTSLQKRS